MTAGEPSLFSFVPSAQNTRGRDFFSLADARGKHDPTCDGCGSKLLDATWGGSILGSVTWKCRECKKITTTD